MADITIRNGDTSQHQHHNAEQKHTQMSTQTDITVDTNMT